MLIHAFTGSIGSGKTYSALKDMVLPALKAGRKVYSNIEGFLGDWQGDDFKWSSERLYVASEVVCKSIDEIKLLYIPLDCRLTENSKKDVVFLYKRLKDEGQGSLVVIDEAQNYASQNSYKSDVLKPWFEFLTMTRHYNIEWVFMTQNISNMASPIRRLIVFEKNFRTSFILGSLGKGRYSYIKYEHFGNDKKKSLMDYYVPVKFDTIIFKVYKSFQGDGLTESEDVKKYSIFRHPVFKIVLVLFLISIFMLHKVSANGFFVSKKLVENQKKCSVKKQLNDNLPSSDQSLDSFNYTYDFKKRRVYFEGGNLNIYSFIRSHDFDYVSLKDNRFIFKLRGKEKTFYFIKERGEVVTYTSP